MESLFIAVLAISAISVSRAEKSLFVLKGSSVRLDMQEYEGLHFRALSWRFNITTAILEYINKSKDLDVFNTYKTRAEFDKKNFSLLLKNMQERDNGIYTAEINDNEGVRRNADSYRLTVQEAPPTPEVGVALLSSAGGFCKVSVNCSAKDTWASYTCDHAHCTQVENTTLSTEVKITVTATNEAIYCSSSNRVGTKTRSESIKDFCTPIKDSFPVGVTVVTIIIISIIIIIITIVYVIYKKRRISGGSQIQEKCNTEYASVEGPGVVLSNPSREVTVYETVTTAKPEHHPKVSTVYVTLGPAGDPPTKPESIYATVNNGAPQPLEE
ncbi:natural killer cell receptor 2B4-like isoform X2 [Anguilla anguilla]|uniref:natural killer cell receptor 2B4-like isoform X2 n=1 Tax=Anguilla anguilla TaxID=7936 RepID=UPI0015A8DC99|nr:natural killer cell receptor 2B4-like isoform X2 [Anguilla anguilla]